MPVLPALHIVQPGYAIPMLSLAILGIHVATVPSLYTWTSYQMGAQPNNCNGLEKAAWGEALVSRSPRYSRY
jgi:hypothetical protein